MKYRYLKDFLPDIDNENKLIEFYSVAGGTPRYIELMESFPDYKSALNKLILKRDGVLYNEAKYLLHEELTSPNTCWSIINAIASGSTKISELAKTLALPANQLTRYIDLLKDLFLIEREVPVIEKNPLKSKKGVYRISDPFVRLWFGCIYPYESFLEFDEAKLIADKLQPLIDTHIAYCFEELCRQYIKNRILDFDCIRIGRQWGKNYEVDIAGVNSRNEFTLLGECKWSNKKVGCSVFLDLQNTAINNSFPLSDNCKYLLFSKSGFSDGLKELANDNQNIILIDSIFSS